MELTQLGAIGIIALVCLALVQTLRPLLQQLIDMQKLLMTRLKEGDDVLDRNTAALAAHSAATDKTIAALEKHAVAFGGLQAAAEGSTSALAQAISEGSAATNTRLDTQSAQLTAITDLLRETKLALDGHTIRDEATSKAIGRVLILIEQMSAQQAAPAPPAEQHDNGSEQLPKAS